jgi:uncharacterized repeat protein (TIGR03803 family)
MNHINAWKAACATLLFCAAATVGASAQFIALTTLSSFDGTNGSDPMDVLAQGLDGNFYGTTAGGGEHSSGTIYKVTPEGVITTLYSFCSKTNCIDGSSPRAGLLLDTDGNFYGTTAEGGTTSNGTIFRITPSGVLTTLHSFCAIEGSDPEGRLTQGSDGRLYGTTRAGGAFNRGTVFRIATTGVPFTRLHSFCSQTDCADGENPTAGLVQEKGGDFYGTTFGSSDVGGSQGTIFKITFAGTLTTLHTFNGADGANPAASLIQGSDGFLYGTTEFGGSSSCLPGSGCGTVFRMSPEGHLTTIDNFSIGPLANVDAGVVVGYDGLIYGTTISAIYRSFVAGQGLNLYTSCCSIGAHPGGLIQGTDGNFYGTAEQGGTAGNGTVFTWFVDRVDNPPFVEALVNYGIVGSNVVLLGNRLTGDTYVEFDGIFAASRVVSDTEVIATVPAGATTGKIKVFTVNGPLTSNVPFRVVPQVYYFFPASGAVGSLVEIQGESLAGANGVSFQGTLATNFIVNGDTSITVTVPPGATTGWIAVHTAGGRSQSAGTFTVTP